VVEDRLIAVFAGDDGELVPSTGMVDPVTRTAPTSSSRRLRTPSFPD
jgi:hypothetical protein